MIADLVRPFFVTLAEPIRLTQEEAEQLFHVFRQSKNFVEYKSAISSLRANLAQQRCSTDSEQRYLFGADRQELAQ